MEAYAVATNVCFQIDCGEDLTWHFWETHLTEVVKEYGISDGGGMGGAPGIAHSFKGKSRKSPGSDCKCFLAGTDVLMADGTTRNIEEVRVGDEVFVTDPETGESAARSVSELIITDEDKHFNEITIRTPQGHGKITATHEHPFWSPSAQQWIAASALEPGTTLRTETGSALTVSENRAYTGKARTYNLTVEDFHTYYVLAGEAPVLVHNARSCTSGNNSAAALGRKAHADFSDVMDGRGHLGYEGEFILPSGRRPDGGYTDPATGLRVPIELKPDSRAQIRRGRKELGVYEQEMGVPTGSGQLWVYRVGQSGTISYQRIR
ncbi:polymorphic toxin-type HINT domain-containing protein [Streptomyces zhihengii]